MGNQIEITRKFTMQINQLPGANQLILNNQLQHPGTQHKETKSQSTIDI